jgi:hypothetical protein
VVVGDRAKGIAPKATGLGNNDQTQLISGTKKLKVYHFAKNNPEIT